MYMFSLNEDTSLVEYKRYYEEKCDVFPALSLCFSNPFSATKLVQAGAVLNHLSYFKFLNGEDMTPKLEAINYESIIMNITGSVKRYWTAFHNGSSQYQDDINGIKALFVNSFSGFLDLDGTERFYGCYRLQIPDDKNIWWLSVELETSVFPAGRRPMNYNFFTLIHHPNQLLTSLASLRYTWAERRTNISYSMRFKVNEVDYIHRRNKISQPCHDDSKNYDDVVLSEHTRKVGCRAPYQTNIIEVRLCSTVVEMKQSRFFLRSDLNGMLQPCKMLQKVMYEYSEADLSLTNYVRNDSFWIGLRLQDPYFMEIRQTR